MPRYFFHTHDGASFPDLVGQDLPNLEIARREAFQQAIKLLGQDAKDLWNGEDWSVDVRDEHDHILFTVHFAATITPDGKKVVGEHNGSG